MFTELTNFRDAGVCLLSTQMFAQRLMHFNKLGAYFVPGTSGHDRKFDANSSWSVTLTRKSVEQISRVKNIFSYPSLYCAIMLFQSGRSRWLGLDGNFVEQPVAGKLVGEIAESISSTIRPNDHSIFIAPSSGRLLTRQEDDGPNSDYYRCFYKDYKQPLL